MKGNNQYGFSMVQLFITLGLFAFILVAGFKMLKNQSHIGESSRFYFEAIYLVDEIKSILSNPESCAQTFENKNAYSQNIEYIFDAQEKNPVRFRRSEIDGPFYSSAKILIKSMELNGNAPEFGIDKGFGLFKIWVTQSLKNGEKKSEFEEISFQFPIHLNVNSTGEIVSCFSLPGLAALDSVPEEKGLWKMSHDEKKSFLVPEASRVKIGEVERKTNASLEIKGGLKLGPITECNSRNIGVLSFEANGEGLKWCQEEGKWIDLNHEKPLVTEFRDYYLDIPKQGLPLAQVTQVKFKFCTLERVMSAAGKCRARPMVLNEYESKWELSAQYLRSSELKCHFRCFR